MNWNDYKSQAITLDFALMGASESINTPCKVTDLWTGQVLGTFTGFLDTPAIAPHDNLAYKIQCLSTATLE
jgi:hypothetical protein